MVLCLKAWESRTLPGLLNVKMSLCETKIIKSSEQEATALGAATLSALGSNEINDLSEFNINSNETVEFLPIIKKQLRSKIIKNWDIAINKTIND